VAYYRRTELPEFLRPIRWSSPWVALAALLLALPIVASTWVYTQVGFLLRTVLSLVYACLVNACVNRIRGFPGRILEFPPLVYLGTISYGLYVLHNFAGFVWMRLKRHVPALPDSYPSIVAFNIIVTVLGAVILWHCFERPINRFKARFPYVDPPLPQAGRSAQKEIFSASRPFA